MEKRDTFQYVPLLTNLERILQNRDIYKAVGQVCECDILIAIVKGL